MPRKHWNEAPTAALTSPTGNNSNIRLKSGRCRKHNTLKRISHNHCVLHHNI